MSISFCKISDGYFQELNGIWKIQSSKKKKIVYMVGGGSEKFKKALRRFWTTPKFYSIL